MFTYQTLLSNVCVLVWLVQVQLWRWSCCLWWISWFNQHSIHLLFLLKFRVAFDGYLGEGFYQHSIHLAGTGLSSRGCGLWIIWLSFCLNFFRKRIVIIFSVCIQEYKIVTVLTKKQMKLLKNQSKASNIGKRRGDIVVRYFTLFPVIMLMMYRIGDKPI